MLVYNKDMVKPADVATYESLADPKHKGKICTRSGSHPYNLSLISSEVAHLGDAKAEAWAKGVVANLARAPKGGDTDQIKAVAAGECAVAISNTYYYARLLRSTQPADKEIVAKTGVVFPDQATYGTHVNISGAGMLKNAPHKENARKFLEYLASDAAQRYFADGNNEWPVVASAKVSNPALDAMGEFKIDPLPIANFGKYTAEAQKIADRSGWRWSAGAAQPAAMCVGIKPDAAARPAARPIARPAARPDSTRIGTIPTATIVSDGSAASARRSSFASRYVCVASVSKLNGRSTSVAGSSFITSTNTSNSAAALLRASRGTCTRRSTCHAVDPRLRAAASIAGVMRAKPGSMPFHATAK